LTQVKAMPQVNLRDRPIASAAELSRQLRLTPLELLDRLAALIPPPRHHDAMKRRPRWFAPAGHLDL
jgi:hypothetical protein